MDTKTLVTVVIPTFNRASLVQKAIRSAQHQTYTNIEIIVVDDASPDNTEEVVRAISDSRILYLRHNINKGLASCGRNTGIQMAKGEYISFLDDDDEWKDTMLEKQLEVIQSYDAVLCAALVNDEQLKCHTSSIVTLNDLRKGSHFDPSSLMVKKDIIKELLFDEGLREGEDWDVFIRIASKYSIGYIKEPLLIYNDGGHERITNEMMDLSPNEMESRMAILNKHRIFFGTFWYQYHLADFLLSYISYKNNKFRQLTYAIRQSGLLAVAAVVSNKIAGQLQRLTNN